MIAEINFYMSFHFISFFNFFIMLFHVFFYKNYKHLSERLIEKNKI